MVEDRPSLLIEPLAAGATTENTIAQLGRLLGGIRLDGRQCGQFMGNTFKPWWPQPYPMFARLPRCVFVSDATTSDETYVRQSERKHLLSRV